MEKGNAHRASPFLHLYDLSAKSALLTHLGEALAAIDGTVFTGLEGHLAGFAAAGADSVKHLALTADSVLAGDRKSTRLNSSH